MDTFSEFKRSYRNSQSLNISVKFTYIELSRKTLRWEFFEYAGDVRALRSLCPRNLTKKASNEATIDQFVPQAWLFYVLMSL